MHGFQDLTNAKIPNLDGSIGIQKDVTGLDIPMQDFVGMDALEPERNLYKPVNYNPLSNGLLAFLVILDEEGEIALLTVLHDNNEHPLLQEILEVLDDEHAVQFLEDFDLSLG
jgi:hypothetical protein